MLRYFRINDPYRLIGLLVLMVMASLPLLIDMPLPTIQEIKDLIVGERVGNKILYVELVDRTPPMMAVMDGLMNTIVGRSLLARHIIALVLLLFQAAYFAILLINNRAYNENTYVPSLIFGFLCFYSFDVLSLSPEVLASTLILLALNNIFKEIEFRVDRDSIRLNLGIFIGLASLIVFSYAIFLVGAILILTLFARTTFRKIMLVVIGFALVHGILFTLYYYYGNVHDLWRNFYMGNFQSGESLLSNTSFLWLGAIPVFFFVMSLFMLNREARFTRYQSQIYQVLFMWSGVAAIELWVHPGLAPHNFITFFPPLAYFISHYLLLIRRKRIAEFMLWLLIGGLLMVNYTSRKGMIEEINYTRLFAQPSPFAQQFKNKRVMVVGEDIGLYSQNSLGGGFADWQLSREYFENPDTYENVIRLNSAFEEDPPEVIIDELNLMPRVFDRLPRVRALYDREGVIYQRR
ncbi:MAG: hypothetical protein JNL40_11770 [Cyclobacteriaceae bacterium]|nr:hypothetical protein [Cyclobacteriaceae bacterium]